MREMRLRLRFPISEPKPEGTKTLRDIRSMTGGGNCGVGSDGRRARLCRAHKRSERIEHHERIQQRVSLMPAILPQRGLGSFACLGICIETSGKPAAVFRIDKVLFNVFPKAQEVTQI